MRKLVLTVISSLIIGVSQCVMAGGFIPPAPITSHINGNSESQLNNPVVWLPKGWHIGYTVCGAHRYGRLCCAEFGMVGCKKWLPFDEYINYLYGSKYEVKLVGITYDIYNKDVIIYYMYRDKKHKTGGN